MEAKEKKLKAMANNFKGIKWPNPKEAVWDTVKVLVVSVAAGTLISMADTLGKALVGLFV